MERFGSFEEDGYKFEAFSARDKEGKFIWRIVVSKNGREVRRETVEMLHWTDEKTGQTEWLNDPRDMANVAEMEKRSSEILEELKAEYGHTEESGESGSDEPNARERPGSTYQELLRQAGLQPD